MRTFCTFVVPFTPLALVLVVFLFERRATLRHRREQQAFLAEMKRKWRENHPAADGKGTP